MCVLLARKEGSCECPRKIALQDPHLGQVASVLKSLASFFLVRLESQKALVGQAGPVYFRPWSLLILPWTSPPLTAQFQESSISPSFPNASVSIVTAAGSQHIHLPFLRRPFGLLFVNLTLPHCLASAAGMLGSILLQRRGLFFF